jgi:sugar O-acyltransferase (sialic acid O-acetyltransferase NeuD family)
MKKKIAIIGAGGHGKVVGEIATLNKYEIIDFFDDKVNEIKNFPFTVRDTEEFLKQNLKNYNNFFVAIGNNEVRKKKINFLKNKKVNVVKLFHPNSIVSKLSTVGEGTCVMANATINPGTVIKEGVIINTSASIDHDCVIDDFAHISPNCSLSGNVKVGKFTHLGTGTSVHPGILIGNNVKIAVGSKVFKNIPDKTIYK